MHVLYQGQRGYRWVVYLVDGLLEALLYGLTERTRYETTLLYVGRPVMSTSGPLSTVGEHEIVFSDHLNVLEHV